MNAPTEQIVGHTSGPWHVAPPEWQGSLRSTVWDRLDLVVAFVDRIDHSGAESDANARLIAAAPDLLDACKRALADWESDVHVPFADVARAAIAKAEGRDNG